VSCRLHAYTRLFDLVEDRAHSLKERLALLGQVSVRVVRRKSFAPRIASSRDIAFEAADGLVPTIRAAAVNEPVSTVRQDASNPAVSFRRPCKMLSSYFCLRPWGRRTLQIQLANSVFYASYREHGPPRRVSFFHEAANHYKRVSYQRAA
jgi:hypothetical protein